MPRRRTTARIAVATATALAASALTFATAEQAVAASCADVDVAYAGGTVFGGDGTAPNTLPDPVFENFAAALDARTAGKSVSYYRVNYPASLEPWSASVGNWDLVQHLRAQAVACPDQVFVLVGYSQGANVVDNAIGVGSDGALVGGPTVAVIPAGIEPKVKAVVLYGNPIRGFPTYRQVTGTYQSRTLDDCAAGDPICGGGWDANAHGAYAQPQHSGPAADFVAARI
ncbi:cutinase family protein [Yinghuangia soli]|uniref:Cutinase family protein n=1 Tax=Yinghuangia soli TaxID=2908204 RepID=A0AA41Q3Y3_9ACTN|nr:cutinase family protein [Yinghuangia soli]MCF2531094.1 cutinase family protein [Yinghuangia soli]